MPSFVVNTNVPRANIPHDFLLDLSKVVAKSTGKPESYVAVQVIPDQLMVFGGSVEPCATCTLGNVGPLKNKDFSKAAMEKISNALDIPTDRIYIFFSNFEGGNVGYNKSTF